MMYLTCKTHLAETIELCFSRSLSHKATVSRVTEHQKGRDCWNVHCNKAADYEVDVV